MNKCKSKEKTIEVEKDNDTMNVNSSTRDEHD